MSKGFTDFLNEGTDALNENAAAKDLIQTFNAKWPGARGLFIAAAIKAGMKSTTAGAYWQRNKSKANATDRSKAGETGKVGKVDYVNDKVDQKFLKALVSDKTVSNASETLMTNKAIQNAATARLVALIARDDLKAFSHLSGEKLHLKNGAVISNISTQSVDVAYKGVNKQVTFKWEPGTNYDIILRSIEDIKHPYAAAVDNDGVRSGVQGIGQSIVQHQKSVIDGLRAAGLTKEAASLDSAIDAVYNHPAFKELGKALKR